MEDIDNNMDTSSVDTPTVRTRIYEENRSNVEKGNMNSHHEYRKYKLILSQPLLLDAASWMAAMYKS